MTKQKSNLMCAIVFKLSFEWIYKSSQKKMLINSGIKTKKITYKIQ